MKPKMIALEEFCYPYGRETIAKGQPFEAENEFDANALKLAGKAKDDDGQSDKGAIVPPEMQPKRKYKTRDMQAS